MVLFRVHYDSNGVSSEMGNTAYAMCVFCFFCGVNQWGSEMMYSALQGSPARGSPFALSLILCAEAFSSLLRKAEAENKIQGVAVSRNAPRISHLFFADDSLLFAGASEDQALEIARIISLYGSASGQQINLDKSVLSFSSNVLAGKREQLRHILGVSICSIHNKYLGLPSTIGRSKMQPFGVLQERVWRKLQG
uniref:Reverse transcriptase domain-containing protein n=1 Tax=Davidia involucrata TaxID=16924 RepID=A0A5B7BU37_DAVIN